MERDSFDRSQKRNVNAHLYQKKNTTAQRKTKTATDRDRICQCQNYFALKIII